MSSQVSAVIGSGIYKCIYQRFVAGPDTYYTNAATVSRIIPDVFTIFIKCGGNGIHTGFNQQHFGSAEKLSAKLVIDHRAKCKSKYTECMLHTSCKIWKYSSEIVSGICIQRHTGRADQYHTCCSVTLVSFSYQASKWFAYIRVQETCYSGIGSRTVYINICSGV